MITEKIYRYPGSVIVWRHVGETDETKMHVWGVIAHNLRRAVAQTREGVRLRGLDHLSFRTLQWAASIPAMVALHATDPDAYRTPGGVRLVGDVPLDDPVPLAPGEIAMDDRPIWVDAVGYDAEAHAAWPACWHRHGPLRRCPLCAQSHSDPADHALPAGDLGLPGTGERRDRSGSGVRDPHAPTRDNPNGWTDDERDEASRLP